MADLSKTFNTDQVASSSDAASDAISKIATVSDVASDALSKIAAVSDVASDALSKVTGLSDVVSKLAVSVASDITSAASDALSKAYSRCATISDAASKALSKANTASDAVSKLTLSTASDLASATSDLTSKINAVMSVASDAKSAASDALSKIAAVSDAASKAMSQANSVASVASDAKSAASDALSKIAVVSDAASDAVSKVLIAGKRCVILKVYAEATNIAAGDGAMYFAVPGLLNGMNLISCGGHLYTAATSGVVQVQLANVTSAVDMLTSAMTWDATEKDTATATSAAVINTSNDNVLTGEEIRVDIDAAASGAKGMELRLTFQAP